MIEGVKVLAFTHYLQGPSCAQMLGDLGADVIKIEAPKGAFERGWSGPDSFVNGVSIFFMLGNRNTRSISVNTKSPEGKEIIYKLAKDADVLIENFRPGVMNKLGFSYEELSKINPGLIYCSMSGFGADGPYKDRPGQDMLAQAIGGLVRMTGKGTPTAVGTSVADAHSSALATIGILAALYDKKQTGKGHKVDVSLLESVLNLQIEPYAYYLNTPEKIWPHQISTGISNTFQASPFGCYETKDDYMAISLSHHEDMLAIFEPGCFGDLKAEDNMLRREEYDAVIAEQVKKKTTAEWDEIMTKQGIWHVKPYTYEEIENDPQVQWNKSIITLHNDKAGDVRVLGHPIKYDGKAPGVRLDPPAKGENTREILSGIGYSDADIDALKEAGVLFWD